MFYICKRNSFGNAEEKCDAVHVFVFCILHICQGFRDFSGIDLSTNRMIFISKKNIR